MRVQVDQNAQIAAVAGAVVALILLFLMGAWLILLVLLGTFGAVGWRVAQLQGGGTSGASKKKDDVL